MVPSRDSREQDISEQRHRLSVKFHSLIDVLVLVLVLRHARPKKAREGEKGKKRKGGEIQTRILRRQLLILIICANSSALGVAVTAREY